VEGVWPLQAARCSHIISPPARNHVKPFFILKLGFFACSTKNARLIKYIQYNVRTICVIFRFQCG